MPHAAMTARMAAAERSARPPLRVGVILAQHFTLSAFAVFIDHLRLAADEGDRSRPLHVQWSIMSSRPETVRGKLRGDAAAHQRAAAARTRSTMSWSSAASCTPARRSMRPPPAICAKSAPRQMPLIGICTGSFILCRTGLMKGRRSCVSWYHYQDFLEAFPGPGCRSPTGSSSPTVRASPAPAAPALRRWQPTSSNSISAARWRRRRARCCCSTGRAPAATRSRTRRFRRR